MKNINKIEWLTYLFIGVLILTGIIITLVDPDYFKYHYVTEDGPIEWLTVIALLAGTAACFYRVIRLYPYKPKLFLSMTFLLGLVFFFVAGEEISWGQRIFDIESSEWLLENNAQGETNLHNMRVNGKKINKLIFTYGLGIVLLSYWFIITPLYKRKPAVASFFDRLAAPIPQPHQVIAYMLVVIIIQTLVFSTKRGELLECCGAMLFVLNILYPLNQKNFSRGN
jgi:hypothetical protein